MTTSEKFCLKWNDFQKNVGTAFGSLRQDEDFTDVTLASVDGQQIQAHKIILAASSPFFQTLLRKNKHAHPLIYMRGIKSAELVAIVDFLYYGETNIYQDDLDSFLNIAEELSLQGLSGGTEENVAQTTTNTPIPKNVCKNPKPQNHQTIQDDNFKINTMSNIYTPEKDETEVKALVVSNFSFAGELHELDEKIKTMMALGQNMTHDGKQTATVCQVCGKEGYRTQIRDHIEANHIDGLVVPCNSCDKTYRSRNALRVHQYNHK